MGDIRAKALAYLRDAAVTVGVARVMPGAAAPHEVVARVRGHEDTYTVRLIHVFGWRCTCPQTHPGGDWCAHIAAVQLVTGHPSAAAKPHAALI